jgi:hypothetical protein
MNKIITKASKIQVLKEQVKKLVVCSGKANLDHCINNCLHGKAHEREKDRPTCHSTKELCKIRKGIVWVVCKPLNKKQREMWIEKELSK